MMFVVITVTLLALLAYDVTRGLYCASCYRRYAIYPAAGRLRGHVLLCRKCFRVHRRRERLRAE
jgi:hypothetical protein